jgi:hypothetical protein
LSLPSTFPCLHCLQTVAQDGWTQDSATGYLYHPKRQIYHDPVNQKYFRLDLHTAEFREYDVGKAKGLQAPSLQRRATSTTSGDTLSDPAAQPRSTSSLSSVTQDGEVSMDAETIGTSTAGFKSQDELLPLRVATETWTGRKDDNEDRYDNTTRAYHCFDSHLGPGLLREFPWDHWVACLACTMAMLALPVLTM